jgi:hypothetical protein
MSEEVPLRGGRAAFALARGGSVAPLVRLGETVRRTAAPCTPAVLALLRHLEQVRFPGAPRALGIDDEGREILTYLHGDVPSFPWPAYVWTDGALTAVAQLLRSFHEAVVTFQPPLNACWQVLVGADDADSLICHNDISPDNTVFVDGLPVAFIDWELAAPGSAEWEIAQALWRWVPLEPPEVYRAMGCADSLDQPRRVRLFCDAYGLARRSTLIDTILHRMQTKYDTIKTWGEAGRPGFAEMWSGGQADYALQSKAFLRARRKDFEAAL